MSGNAEQPNPSIVRRTVSFFNPITAVRSEFGRWQRGANVIHDGFRSVMDGVENDLETASLALQNRDYTPVGPDPAFEAAMQYYGRTEDDLRQISAGLTRRFWFYCVIAAFPPSFGILNVIYFKAEVDLFYTLTIAVFTAIPLTRAFQSALHHWQIRAKRIGGVRQFLRMPSQWIPR
jgi:hypothetical protein